jgi:hypothetical protein
VESGSASASVWASRLAWESEMESALLLESELPLGLESVSASRLAWESETESALLLESELPLGLESVSASRLAWELPLALVLASGLELVSVSG